MDVFTGFSFGKMAAHGGKSIDLRLTTIQDDDTLARMLAAREGEIGANCPRDTKHRGGVAYPGPGNEPVKSSVSQGIRFASLTSANFCCVACVSLK